MTLDRADKPDRAEVSEALDLALEQSHEVKAKVETCADELATANEIMKEKIAGGATVLSAHQTLAAGTTVEGKVQECADDLQEVTETLAQGIEELAQTEIALTKSRGILADTQAALAISQEEERDVRRRADQKRRHSHVPREKSRRQLRVLRRPRASIRPGPNVAPSILFSRVSSGRKAAYRRLSLPRECLVA